MRRHRAILLLAGLLCAAAAPGAPPAPTTPSPEIGDLACPTPPEFALHDLDLPAARAAVRGKRLVIMTMGGNASAGVAADGQQYTYPSRLAARLQQQLPGVDVSVVSRSALRQSASASVRHLDEDLQQTTAKLVIWGVGGIEAGVGVDPDRLAGEIGRGVSKIRAAGADVILMDLQYAPSLALVVNLAAYRETALRVADDLDVPILDRYGLMQEWSEDGTLNFDVTEPAQRIHVARQLFDCLAAALAGGIAPAVR